MADFVTWLEQQIEDRGWNRNELSKRAGIDSGLVSRILNRERNAGPETLNSIAHAFRLPPETVYRAAGLLPPTPEKNEQTEKLTHLFDQLTDTDREEVIQFVELKLKRAQERSQAETLRDRLEALPPEAEAEIIRLIDEYLSSKGYQKTG